MRILKGWTKKERKELEEAKDGGFSSAMTLIRCGIGDDCYALSEKYYRGDTNDSNQMAKDIVDFYYGNAKFPEQKYYVHLIKGDENSYLNITSDGGAELDSKFGIDGWKTKLTRDEIVAIDPRLVPFMEDVEDDEQNKNNMYSQKD